MQSENGGGGVGRFEERGKGIKRNLRKRECEGIRKILCDYARQEALKVHLGLVIMN